MALTSEDVVQAFEMILGRTPDQRMIDYHRDLPFEDRRVLAEYLIRTDEFRDRYDEFVAQGMAPSPRNAAPPSTHARPVTVFLGDRVMSETHRGQLIYMVPTDLDLAPHIMRHGFWEPHVERAAFGQLRPGGTAVDIGANIGYHMLAMAAAVGHTGHVHAFEANPELIPLLRGTIMVNGCRPYVTLHHKAVMDQPGTITLAQEPDHFGSGNVVPASMTDPRYHADYSRQHQVEGVMLDSALAHLPSLDVVRIDIEGSEPQALRGGEQLIRRSPGVGIVAEWSMGMMQARSDVGAFIEWMTGMGFRFWVISPQGPLFQPVDRDALVGLPHSDVFISRRDPV